MIASIIRIPLGLIGWGIWLLPDPLYRVLILLVAGILRAGRVREKVVRENLARAYPNETAHAQEVRLRLIYQHLGALFWEFFFVFGPLRWIADHRVEVIGFENWVRAQGRGKGVFMLSSHVGNWEFMVAHGAWTRGIDLMMVTKRLKPGWFHDLYEGARSRAKVQATYEPRTLRDLLATLKRGGTVGFVLDQFTGPPVGIEVPFFGAPVGTHSALATLARRTEAPVVPVVIYRVGPPWKRRYRIELRPALEWLTEPGADSKREIELNTAAYTQIIEQDVRLHPEQWLWTHRRFKKFGSSIPTK